MILVFFKGVNVFTKISRLIGFVMNQLGAIQLRALEGMEDVVSINSDVFLSFWVLIWWKDSMNYFPCRKKGLHVHLCVWERRGSRFVWVIWLHSHKLVLPFYCISLVGSNFRVACLLFWVLVWSNGLMIQTMWAFCRKTRGMGAGRKLKSHRIRQRWADKAYKKSNLGNEWKKPFAGSSHAKGIVLEKM